MRRSRSRRGEWWISFALFGALGVVWAVATPLYAAPDEPDHAIRAASVVRGELIGERKNGLPAYDRIVEVPRHLVKGGSNQPDRVQRRYVPCFAFHPERTAACFGSLDPASGEVHAPTSVALDPPAFYAIVGLPSLLTSSAVGVYLMRAMSGLVCAALLSSALLSLRSVAPPWLAASGLGLALTPMVAFLAGTVNPNGVEVSAAIGAWASFAILAHDAADRVDAALVRRAAIAMTVLVLARGLSPLWLGIIGVTGLALCTRDGLSKLVTSSRVRRWSLAVIGASVFAVIWIVTAKPLESLVRHGADPGTASTWTLIRSSLGSTYRQTREMVGVFGWLDAPSPALTYLLWTIGVTVLVIIALVVASRRHAVIVVALVALSIAVPVAIDVSQARNIGLGWQGRWTLPLAVGVPIVAALALAWSNRRPTWESHWLPRMMAAGFVIAQFAAFAQALRRYTVGANGSLDFWLHPSWSPPLPAWLLLGVSLATLASLATWIWRPSPFPATS